MSNQVYANNMEVSCKAAAGKSICAFPDVCFTPPTTPATPPGVPIPYPNTGMASDTTSGSTSVKISGKEVMLKNKSYFKKSMGDEAGCAPKKGVITSKNMGKVYFTKWSMDVKAEGENVVRNLDLTTHNHASWVGNTPPQVYLDRMAMGFDLAECAGARDKVTDKCKDFDEIPCPDESGVKAAESLASETREVLKSTGMTEYKRARHQDTIAANQLVNEEYERYSKGFGGDCKEGQCLDALKCFLSPQSPSRCCDKQTPHHLIPASSIVKEGARNQTGGEPVLKEFAGYKSLKAPCVCVEGPSADIATHKKAHNAWADRVSSLPGASTDLEYSDGHKETAQFITYEQATTAAKESMAKVAPHCDPACTEAQLNSYHFGDKDLTDDQKKTKIRRTMDEEQYKSDASEF